MSVRRIALGVLPALVLGLSVGAPVARAGLTFDVNSTGDHKDAAVGDHACDAQAGMAGDQCTLRAAMQEANADAGTDVIDFHIPGPGVKTIAPDIELPYIRDPVVINGYSQGVASPNTESLGQGDNATLLVQVTGQNISNANIDGLLVLAGGSGTVIKGLVINGFGDGIRTDYGTTLTVRGNFIGTGPGGNAGAHMFYDGIFNNGHAQIGGSTPAARNLVSGNGDVGISGDGTATTEGNYIGTKRDGVSPLGNGLAGIWMNTSNNTVRRNVIAFNGQTGVTLVAQSMNNPISRNRIFSNGGLGIDLGGHGRTHNDHLDADTGPNEKQNFPVITSATRSSGQLVLDGRLQSTPDQNFTLEFFRNPQGGGEGEDFLDDTTVGTNSSGIATFDFHTSRLASVGDSITATATNAHHSTSEFSAPGMVGP